MNHRFTNYSGDSITLARRLLGQQIVHQHEGQRLAGTIVETEAYLGPQDRASQTYRGHRSPRNESMYLPAGHAYVYFTYGMHEMLCVVSGERNEGTAILIRALEPTEGIDFMFSRRLKARKITDLCSGPGKLTQALAINRSQNGINLVQHKSLYLETPNHPPPVPSEIKRTKRVGIGDCGIWTHRQLRFYLQNNPHTSRPENWA